MMLGGLGSKIFFLFNIFPILSANEYPHTHDDPWTTRDKCQQLPYPQCQCNESRVNCVNAQMTQTDVFLHVQHYPHVSSVTFIGNNFMHLPSHVLGMTQYDQLGLLNLSANYFVKVEPDAFRGMPNLISLDLSHNAIVFDRDDSNLITELSKLEELHLRDVFPDPTPNLTQQVEILHNMLIKGKLNKLRLLDLSYNNLETLPAKFGCDLPNLEILLLAGNKFRTFHFDSSCYRRLKKLDLSDNSFTRLDQRFMKFCDNLPRNSVTLHPNPFVCGNRSADYVEWILATQCVEDRAVIKCQPGADDTQRVRVFVLDGRWESEKSKITSSSSAMVFINVFVLSQFWCIWLLF